MRLAHLADHGDLSYLAVPQEDMSSGAAMRLLRDRKLAPLSLVRVDPYGIAFLNRCGKVRTAWTRVETLAGGKFRLVVTVENGLPAFPTDARST